MEKLLLTVLGDVELRTRGGDLVGSVLNQPRRLALLVYLALEAQGGHVQRDRLLGLFWADVPQEQARQSLRTALHFLRRSLGSAAITGDGGGVGVDAAVVSCDAAAFRSLRGSDPEAALALYRGDLLPGFYLDDGPPEFERWLEETRAALRREAAEAAWSLAGDQERAGNAPGAGAWARRAAELFEKDEAAVRRSIEVLGRIGDRAGALAAYEELARQLDKDYGAQPSPATQAAIAAAREDRPAGEQGRAPEAESSEAADPIPIRRPGQEAAPARAEPVAPASAAGWRRAGLRASRAAYSTAVTVVLMVAFYSLWGLSRSESSAMTRVPMAPVLQIEEMRDLSGSAAAADLAGALTLEITGRLSGIGSLQVVPLGQAESLDRLAGATYIVRGALLQSDSIVRVTAVLLDGASGATLERITAERAFASATETTAELGEVLARGIRREIGRVVEDRERSARSHSPRALSLVQSALRDAAAADSLRSSGALDAALVSLAAADSQLALAQASAPRWPEPPVQRAELAQRRMWLHLSARDLSSAGQPLDAGVSHADAALAIAPDDPVALEVRGLLNYWRWRLRSAGTEAENEVARRSAEADLARATALDAGRARAWSILSALHETRGEFAAANIAARRSYHADPYLENAVETVVRLFATSLEVGDYPAAARWCDELGKLAPGSWVRASCPLERMAWEGPPAGMDAAAISDLVGATIEGVRGAGAARAELSMLGAVILARAGFPTEALAAIHAARNIGGEEDAIHLLGLEAWARLIMGDEATAAALLSRAAAVDGRGAVRIIRSSRFDWLRTEGSSDAMTSPAD